LEAHLFKWVDEALLDETRMVEEKHLKLVEDVKQLRNFLMDNMERLKTMVAKMEEEIKEIMDEKMKTELLVANAAMEKMAREMVKKTIQKMGVAVLLVGGIAWVCGKFLS
jgi:tRNA U34 5-carboxymethylaminomethyl modifying GTPase MnmE/TrmE